MSKVELVKQPDEVRNFIDEFNVLLEKYQYTIDVVLTGITLTPILSVIDSKGNIHKISR